MNAYRIFTFDIDAIPTHAISTVPSLQNKFSAAALPACVLPAVLGRAAGDFQVFGKPIFALSLFVLTAWPVPADMLTTG